MFLGLTARDVREGGGHELRLELEMIAEEGEGEMVNCFLLGFFQTPARDSGWS